MAVITFDFRATAGGRWDGLHKRERCGNGHHTIRIGRGLLELVRPVALVGRSPGAPTPDTAI